ncbi:hypothetical protein KY311_01000 [Candidatus Woesearchaeota archaeon]|nr:hypothetical protein [Candidatus Woesearchaeota archaeon]
MKKDYWQEHPEELKGQPKRTIADYVEANGILVPRRFDSLEEARRTKKAVILRSEHPQEYAGVSGLLHSPELSSVMIQESKDKPPKDLFFSPRGLNLVEDVKNAYFEFQDNVRGKANYLQYCNFLGISPEKFKREASFSVWQLLPGYNRFVIADSAIHGRYHITTSCYKDGSMYNYTLIDNGKITQQYGTSLTPELIEGLENLIGLYERIRHLSRFDQNHCPILEIQTANGKHYFLQYHRCRDFEPAEFVLDRKPDEDEIAAPFLRGVTSKEGMHCKTTLVHAGSHRIEFNVNVDEEGAFDMHYCKVFAELMARKRKLQLIPINSDGNITNRLVKFVACHDTITKLFKPQVSIPINEYLLFSRTEFLKMQRKMVETNQSQYMDLYVISDGRKAYIKRIK